MLVFDKVAVAMGDATLEADLSIGRDARVAILGPSGAGKSTLLDVVAGFRQPLRGTIRFDGADLTGREPSQRPVSILFQDGKIVRERYYYDPTQLG